MLKITTKRSEREEEALREEGRREARDEEIRESLERIFKRKHVRARDVEVIPATRLRAGHILYESDGIRGGHEGERVTFVGLYYPHLDGRPTREGTVWVVTEGDPERGVVGGGGSLIDDDDAVLVVRREEKHD